MASPALIVTSPMPAIPLPFRNMLESTGATTVAVRPNVNVSFVPSVSKSSVRVKLAVIESFTKLLVESKVKVAPMLTLPNCMKRKLLKLKVVAACDAGIARIVTINGISFLFISPLGKKTDLRTQAFF